jgi:hypothetical protein
MSLLPTGNPLLLGIELATDVAALGCQARPAAAKISDGLPG